MIDRDKAKGLKYFIIVGAILAFMGLLYSPETCAQWSNLSKVFGYPNSYFYGGYSGYSYPGSFYGGYYGGLYGGLLGGYGGYYGGLYGGYCGYYGGYPGYGSGSGLYYPYSVINPLSLGWPSPSEVLQRLNTPAPYYPGQYQY